RREEVTTEGGLALTSPGSRERLRPVVERLAGAGIRTSLFIDPSDDALEASAELGVAAVEFHTGEYANARDARGRTRELDRLARAAGRGRELGLDVHAGHGLTYENVTPVAAIQEIEELNIGHSVISRAIFTGMQAAVAEMASILRRARRP
ncbi:MAG: pyridoxine 5'-phosphate synthase, partial [Gemmatimonadota bacterium]